MTFISILIILLIFYFQYSLRENNENYKEDNNNRVNVPSVEESIIFIIACVMSADDKLTKNELTVVKKFLSKNFEEKKAKAMLLNLRDELKNLEYEEGAIDLRPYCLSLNLHFSYTAKIELLKTLFRIAVTDGLICDKEAQILNLYAQYTKIRSLDFSKLKYYYAQGYQWNESEDYRKRRNNNSQTTSSSTSSNDWAYKTLGIPSTATANEIKKAYRKLVQQYHPDKQIGKSEEEIKKATEKFRKIDEAYDVIMKEKGL